MKEPKKKVKKDLEDAMYEREIMGKLSDDEEEDPELE